MKLALLGVVACMAVIAATSGDRRERQPATAVGAAATGPRAPSPVHPRRPAHYRVPRNAIRVTDAAELRNRLKQRRRTAIVLANGRYAGRRPFLNPYGRRLYAATQGRAVLLAGLSLGGNEGSGGALVRGVVVDVGDARRTVDGAPSPCGGRGARRASSTPRFAAAAG